MNWFLKGFRFLSINWSGLLTIKGVLRGLHYQYPEWQGKFVKVIAPSPHYSVLYNEKLEEVYHEQLPHWRTSLEYCLTGH